MLVQGFPSDVKRLCVKHLQAKCHEDEGQAGTETLAGEFLSTYYISDCK